LIWFVGIPAFDHAVNPGDTPNIREGIGVESREVRELSGFQNLVVHPSDPDNN